MNSNVTNARGHVEVTSPPMRKFVGWTPLLCLANRLSARLARLDWNMRHIPIISEAPFQPTPMKTAPTLWWGQLRLPYGQTGASGLRCASPLPRSRLDTIWQLLAGLAGQIGRDKFAHRFPPFISLTPSAWLPLKGLRGQSYYA